MKQLFIAFLLGTLFSINGQAQNYHAIQGSNYSGALGVHNNPASIVNTPFSWDLAVMGLQLTTSTNAFTIYNYSLLSSPANSKYYFKKGEFARFADLNFNLNLINTHFALNRKTSIAFGANIRGYTNASTSQFNFIDTLHGTGNFFLINQNNNNLQAKMSSSSWLEVFATYSHTLFENEYGRLNAGLTVKVSKGISGVYANINSGRFTSTFQNNKQVYEVTNANAVYGYSANYDQWKKTNTTNENLNNFLLASTEGGASFDLGVEYLIKPQGTTSFDDEVNYYDYDWKIGLSLLDIGGNQYKYGTESRSFTGLKTNIDNLTLDKKFDSTTQNLKNFNDSIATITNMASIAGIKYKVLNPMRMVINIDRYLYGNFYINADLVIGMPPSLLKKYQRVRDMGMLTVTPRWETKNLGVYLPIQYNANNQFWIGGAFKAGPLLLGVHNWANVFAKNKMQNGGGYIALIFHSPKDLQGKRDKKLDCPKAVW
jgi:hypothetical protein